MSEVKCHLKTGKSQYHLRIDYIGNDYMFFSIPQLVVGAQTLRFDPLSKDVPRLRLGGQMASPRSSSSGVYTSRTETGLKAVELCMRSIGQVPPRSELFEPQSSVSASGSNREVQATGGCGDYWDWM